MKFTTIIAVLALLGVSTEALTVKNKVDQANLQKVFTNFVSKYQRNYRNNDEYNSRLTNFMKNYQIVQDNNNGNSDFELEMNKFSDLSDKEYNSLFGLRADLIKEEDDNNAEEFVLAEVDQSTYPTSLDWRTKGVVPKMKNQASCGSCYSFSALESLQSLYHIKKGPVDNIADIINLSEQQIVDCSTSYGNQGCNGGLMSYSFNYLKNQPIMLESDYTYTARKGTCKHSASKGKFKVTSYTNLPKNDPNALMQAIQKGPVSIALNAGASVFQLYKSGIISSTSCGTRINHAVTLVGYGTENGTPYWLIKNSWGTTWGQSGYVKIKRTTTKDAGICGMLSLSSQPTGISI